MEESKNDRETKKFEEKSQKQIKKERKRKFLRIYSVSEKCRKWGHYPSLVKAA